MACIVAIIVISAATTLFAAGTTLLTRRLEGEAAADRVEPIVGDVDGEVQAVAWGRLVPVAST